MQTAVNKKRILSAILAVIAILLMVSLYSLHQSRFGLTVTNYTMTADVSEEIRIVQLSDLHGMVFGAENEKLIEAVRSQKPDVIAMTGDMFSMDAEQAQVDGVCQLIASVSQIAPVYYALGNHEIAYMQLHGNTVLDSIEESGAVILEQNYADIRPNGQAVRIGGCYGYLLSRNYRSGPEQDFMDDFLNTDAVTVLMAHMPEGLLDYNCIDSWNPDLVLSGHTHGGQIRLPLIGGLYDPEVGWFPEYERGFFQRDHSVAVVSAGLGSSADIPRFGNRPEIITVDLIPESNN